MECTGRIFLSLKCSLLLEIKPINQLQQEKKNTTHPTNKKISILQPTPNTYTEWEIELFCFIPMLARVYVLMYQILFKSAFNMAIFIV